MTSTWPIRWGFGGIAWGSMNGVRSLYVALRYGEPDGRSAIGFVIRIGDRRGALFSARKKRWMFGRVLVARIGA